MWDGFMGDEEILPSYCFLHKFTNFNPPRTTIEAKLASD